jgi:hypothetical protein
MGEVGELPFLGGESVMSQAAQLRRGAKRGRKPEAVVSGAASLRDQPAGPCVRLILIRDGQLVDPPEMREVKAALFCTVAGRALG